MPPRWPSGVRRLRPARDRAVEDPEGRQSALEAGERKARGFREGVAFRHPGLDVLRGCFRLENGLPIGPARFARALDEGERPIAIRFGAAEVSARELRGARKPVVLLGQGRLLGIVPGPGPGGRRDAGGTHEPFTVTQAQGP